MGSFLCLPLNRMATRDQHGMSQMEAWKRLRMSLDCCDENPRLIPSLPAEISLQILARLPRIRYLSMQLVPWNLLPRWVAV